MLHTAAALFAIALLAAVFGLGGLAHGMLGALQIATVLFVGAGLGSLLLRIARR